MNVATPAGTVNRTVRIVLVDDHAILRQGLRSILEREPDLEVVGEASHEAEALTLVGRVRPDIVLMDLKLSAGSDYEGLTLCGQLSAAHPGLGLLVLTTFLDEQLVVRAVHAGARGYVVKDVDTTYLRLAQRRGGGAFPQRADHAAGTTHRARTRGAAAARGRLVQRQDR